MTDEQAARLAHEVKADHDARKHREEFKAWQDKPRTLADVLGLAGGKVHVLS